MKYLIISDIHSNFEALKCVIEEIEKTRYDRIISLGDIIGYGPDPSECIKIVKEENVLSIAGNHERMLINPSLRKFANINARKAIEWTEQKISISDEEFLRLLHDSLEDSFFPILYVHGSPNDPDEYILTISTAMRSLRTIESKGINICFFGHSHIPGIIDEDGNYYYQPETTFSLRPDKHYLINPGSVGQPRDRDRRCSFCTLDTEKLSVFFHRKEYNISRTVEKINENNLPEELGIRLWYGI